MKLLWYFIFIILSELSGEAKRFCDIDDSQNDIPPTEKEFACMNENDYLREEAAFEHNDESIAMDMDYDHLMAYFDSLKESSA